MSKSMPQAKKAAWFMFALCILIVLALIAMPLIAGGSQPLGSAGILFIAFFFWLPWPFFWVAEGQQQQQDQIRELQARIEELEGRAAHGRGEVS
jgi:hypothetical protein